MTVPKFLQRIFKSKAKADFNSNKYLNYNGLAYFVEKILNQNVCIKEEITTYAPGINEMPSIVYGGHADNKIIEVYLNGMRLNPLTDYRVDEEYIHLNFEISSENNEVMIVSHEFRTVIN